MKAIAVIVIVIVVFCLIAMAVDAIKLARQRYAILHGKWQPREVTKRGYTQMYLVKSGVSREPYGLPISMRLPEAEYQELLTERRIGAQERCDTMNRRLSA